jgi:hypothetical protein
MKDQLPFKVPHHLKPQDTGEVLLVRVIWGHPYGALPHSSHDIQERRPTSSAPPTSFCHVTRGLLSQLPKPDIHLRKVMRST